MKNVYVQVNVLRSIPGDDSGLLEELVLLVDREFIREREAGAEVTRTKWFTSSLEQMELVRREGGGGKSGHVIGDRVGDHVTIVNTLDYTDLTGSCADGVQHSEDRGKGEAVHDV